MNDRETVLAALCILLALLCFLSFFGGMFLALQNTEQNNQVVNELEDIFQFTISHS